MSANRWRRELAAGGRAALASMGAGGARCKLTPGQLRELEAVLDAGPVVSGWDEDQCWTLARIAAVIRTRFGVEYTLAGVCLLLHRIAWSLQVPGPVRRPRAGRAQGLAPLWAATADQRAGTGRSLRASLPAACCHQGAAVALECPGTGR